MVIRDDENNITDVPEKLPDGFRESDHLSHQLAMASPFDRAAAVVIDHFIILMPFIYLVVAPFQYRMKEAAIVSDQMQMSYSFVLAFFAVLVLLFTYQTICIWLWGATIGKYLLGLRVKGIFGEKRVRLFQAFVRTVFWSLSCLFLGIPFLASFSNLMRRPLHDRIADTTVLTLRRERQAAVPSYQERSMVRGVYWACGVFLSILFLTALMTGRDYLISESEPLARLEDDELLCDEVAEAQMDWPGETATESETNRLEIAMALFASGSVDRKCLQYEVEYLTLNKKESALVYLAKSFVYSDQSELSEMYLNKVCEFAKDSHECRLSEIVLHVSNDDWDLVSTNFDYDINNAPIYTLIWATRQFLDRQEYQSAKKFIDRLPDMKLLSDFMVPARAKILWGLREVDAAKGLELAAYSTLSEEAKLDVSSFLCYEELWNSCENRESRSCKNLTTLVEKVDDSLSDLKTSLAFLRKWECDQVKAQSEARNLGQNQITLPNVFDYEPLLSQPLHPDVRMLVGALSDKKLEDISELLKDDTLEDDISSEVSRRMITRLNSVGALELLSQDWALHRRNLNWIKTGETLFHKYLQLKEYEKGLHVLDEIAKAGFKISQKLIEGGVVAAMRLKQEGRARVWLEEYSRHYPLPFLIQSKDRQPASESEFVGDVLKLQRGGQ